MLVLTRSVGQRVFIGKKYTVRCINIEDETIILSVFDFQKNEESEKILKVQEVYAIEPGIEVSFLKFVDKRQVCLGFVAPRGMAILRDNIKRFKKPAEAVV